MVGIPNKGTTIPQTMMDLLQKQLDRVRHIGQTGHLNVKLGRQRPAGLLIVRRRTLGKDQIDFHDLPLRTKLFGRLSPTFNLNAFLQYLHLIPDDGIAMEHLRAFLLDGRHHPLLVVQFGQLGQLFGLELLQSFVVSSQAFGFDRQLPGPFFKFGNFGIDPGFLLAIVSQLGGRSIHLGLGIEHHIQYDQEKGRVGEPGRGHGDRCRPSWMMGMSVIRSVGVRLLIQRQPIPACPPLRADRGTGRRFGLGGAWVGIGTVPTNTAATAVASVVHPNGIPLLAQRRHLLPVPHSAGSGRFVDANGHGIAAAVTTTTATHEGAGTARSGARSQPTSAAAADGCVPTCSVRYVGGISQRGGVVRLHGSVHVR